MIPEIGHFTLIVALVLALLQMSLPLIGATKGINEWTCLAKPTATMQFLCMVIAFGCLTRSFIVNDFSVNYVANNSNTALPLLYRISAVWGAHEGSLLLWATILALWSFAVALFSRNIPENIIARVIGVMGGVSVGFLLFTLLTSNPFDRRFPVPAQGRDLNPLLQDPGLAIHPPMLYMGYVGLSVAFAFAIAALLSGKLDAVWARWARPWTNIAWAFLTAGIALGSWWAYYELGWGGWWFWDPVENASFMPWIVATALIHSLIATEKRGMLKAWTVLLSIFAFSLSLLGTFLVRSGVLTSVHAFATDPTRGLFILVFLAIVVGGSLTLYAWRAPLLRSATRFSPVSRETGLLLNNLLLIALALSILLGTIYPLIIDALGLPKLSVGSPYFNSIFIPLTIPLAIFIGIGTLARWKKDQLKRLLWRLRYAIAGSVVIGILLPVFAMPELPLSSMMWAVIGAVLACWVCFATFYSLWERIKIQGNRLRHLRQLPRDFYGMFLAHLGVAVFILGITFTTLYSKEQDVRLSPGQSFELGGHSFTFHGVEERPGANYKSYMGRFTVTAEGKSSSETIALHPEKRFYFTSPNPMTEAGIDPGLFRDLFVALGEPLSNQGASQNDQSFRNTDGAWSVRLYYKPFIRWIWLGCIFMLAGGIVSASDKRFRSKKKVKQSLPSSQMPQTLATNQRV